MINKYKKKHKLHFSLFLHFITNEIVRESRINHYLHFSLFLHYITNEIVRESRINHYLHFSLFLHYITNEIVRESRINRYLQFSLKTPKNSWDLYEFLSNSWSQIISMWSQLRWWHGKLFHKWRLIQFETLFFSINILFELPMKEEAPQIVIGSITNDLLKKLKLILHKNK